MASLRTAGCRCEYLDDRAGAPCVWCGAPRPESWRPVLGADIVTLDPALARADAYGALDRYLTGRDLGDEDHQR